MKCREASHSDLARSLRGAVCAGTLPVARTHSSWRGGSPAEGTDARGRYPGGRGGSRWLVCLAAWCFAIFSGTVMVAEEQNRPDDLHTPEGHYQFAQGLYVRKFYDLAEKEFRVFLTRYPNHKLAPEATFRLIVSLRNQGKMDEMLSAINQFQARWPGHKWEPQLFFWKGEYLMKKEKFAAAEACFRRSSVDSTSLLGETSLFFMAQCQEKQGKREAALASYGKIANRPFDAEHPYRPYALFALALANQRDGKNEAAGKDFTRLTEEDHVPAALREEALYRLGETLFAREKYREAIEVYRRCLAEKPDGAFAGAARKRLSWAYFLLKDYAKAAEAASAWRSRHPNGFDADMDYIHAAGLVGVEFYKEALPLLTRLADDPRTPANIVRLARFQRLVCLEKLKQLGDLAAGCEAFAKDFPKAPELPNVFVMGGQAYYHLKQYDKAIPLLRKACDAFLGDWTTYAGAAWRLGDCLEQEKRYQDAAAVYREAAGKKGVAQPAAFLYRAAQCERKAGARDAAIRDFEALLRQFPEAAEEKRAAMEGLGELYSSKGELDRAAAMVKTLIENSKTGRARLRFFLGYLYYRQQKFTEAVQTLKAALAEPNSGAIAAKAKFFLGGSLLELGRSDEALTVFGEILSLPESERPDFPPDLLFRLDKLYFSRDDYAVSEAICRWLMESPEGEVVYRATLRLADILAVQDRLQEAENQLETLLRDIKEGKVTFPASSKRPREEEIASVLSEIYLLEGKLAQALVSAELCLSCKTLGREYVTRVRWVMGEALLRQGYPMQALPYAVKAYVLDSDPVYSPKAMVLALRILVREKRMDEARSTLTELRKRYPVYAESVAGEPAVRAVMEAEAAARKAADSPPEKTGGEEH